MSWIDTGTQSPIADGTEVTSSLWQQKVTQPQLDLAARVADTGWTTFSIAGNWQAVNGNPLQYRRIGSWLVIINGQITRTTNTLDPSATWTATAFATLPSGFRPVAAACPYVVPVAGGTVGTVLQVQLNSDGTMNARNLGSASLPIGGYMNINFQFPLG